jgi:uncharacterized protein YndB with AHSA1/START domain
MSEPTVQREIDVPMTADEVWHLVADGDGWTEWLVDEADVTVAPGAGGTVVEDGERRDVRIDDVVPGERVAWTWWPTERPDLPSSVELVVVGRPLGSVVRITEVRATAPARWSARARLLGLAGAVARV